MATVQDLQDKVAAAAEKVEKIKATIGKHEAGAAKKLAALAKFGITAENMQEKKWKGGKAGTGGSEYYWEIYAVESKLSDAVSATKKLIDAEKILENWKAKLDLETEKDRFMNDNAPAVIKEFLEQWKQKAYKWYVQNYPIYVEVKKAYNEAKEVAEKTFLEENPNVRWRDSEVDKFVKSQKDVKELGARMSMYGGLIVNMDTYYNEVNRLTYLEKELEADKKYKMLDLIYRVNAVVGSITDASGLSIDVKGNLNGIIIGDKATATVNTIGAGGWNIQCWHYRTLVHKLK